MFRIKVGGRLSTSFSHPKHGLQRYRSPSTNGNLAISLAKRNFKEHLVGYSVVIFYDNMTAVPYLKKAGGTKSATLKLVA